jgi:predicted esterase
LLGLSQGGSIVLLTALFSNLPIGGFFSFSGFIPFQNNIEKQLINQANKRSPIFMFHGKNDKVVPLK